MAGDGRRSASPRHEALARTRPLGVQLALLAVLLVAGWFLLFRQQPPGEIPQEALAAARAAGCDPLERPVVAEPARGHLSPGEPFAYEDPPAAAGPHDPSPLPTGVHDRPVAETRAVHNLEHGDVVIWYRPTADGGLSEATVGALEDLARERDGVIVAPYEDLPEGRSLALLAWNVRWLCPAGLGPAPAVTIAEGFVGAFRGTTVAPEAPRGVFGPLLRP